MTEDETVGWHHRSKDMSLRKLRETVGREAWHATVQGVAKRHNAATEQQQVFTSLVFFIPSTEPDTTVDV